VEFTPSVYEHAARLIGRTPWEVSRNPELLAAGHGRALELYQHRPVVVGIDIYNLEAEAYGAKVQQPSGTGIPAISSAPLTSTKELLTLEPLNPRTDGRIPMVIEAAKRIGQRHPNADVRIPLSGPFSIAANLMGFESLLCEVSINPDSVCRALCHLVTGQLNFCREIVNEGLDIAFFESAAAPPMLSPQNFRRIELAPLKMVLEETASITGHPVPCIIGGNTYPILDALLETGTGYLICPYETDQKRFMDRMRGYPEIMVRINMDVRAIVSNDFAAARRELHRICELAAGREKICIGTGALPYEADPQMVIRIKEYVSAR
jgi:uroporphyrinogen decarboxylase